MTGGQVRRSPRVALKKSFSKFTNDSSNPILIDSTGESVKRKADESVHIQSTARMLHIDDDFVVSTVKPRVEAEQDTVERLQKKGKMVAEEVVKPRVEAEHETVERLRKKVKMVAEEQEDDDTGIELPKIRSRSSPKCLNDVIQTLSSAQKKYLDTIWFSKMLSFKLDGLPGVLGYFVVDHLDTNLMEIAIGSGVIKITPEVVSELLGIPLGGKEIVNKPCSREAKDAVERWKNCYETKEISPNDISKRIKANKRADWNFKVDFCMLFTSTMVDCQRNGKCRFAYIQNFVNEDEINNLDWCGCIYKAIKGCKSDWAPSDPSYYFTSPLTVLMLVYLDATKLTGDVDDVETMAIARWSKAKIRERQKAEIDNGGMGNVEIKSKYKEDETVEGYMKKIEAVFIDLEKKRDDIKEVLIEAGRKYPGCSMLNIFRSRVCELFKEFNEPTPDCMDLVTCPSPSVHGTGTSSYFDANVPTAQSPSRQVDESVATASIDLPDMTGMVPDSLTQVLDDPIKRDAFVREVDEKVASYYKSTTKRTTLTSVSRVAKHTTCEAPSFSLGLTQAFNETTPCAGTVKTPMCVNDEDDDNVPLIERMRKTVDERKLRAKSTRNVKASYAIKSPFMVRCVELNKTQNEDDRIAWKFIWNVPGHKYEVLFKTESGFNGKRRRFETFKNGTAIDMRLVDCFGMVLNYDEKFKSNASPLRLFMLTTHIPESVDKYRTDNPDYVDGMISFNIRHVCEANKCEGALQKLTDVHLVFFPVLFKEHYLLVCVDVKFPTVYIVDHAVDVNMELGADAKRDSLDIATAVRDYFVKYMRSIGHANAELVGASQPQFVHVKWATVDTHIDCGIYLMRHMESFMGPVWKNWDCGFASDMRKRRSQILELRKKYCSKILNSDVNTLAFEMHNKVSSQKP